MTSRFWIWIWLLAIAWSSQAFADTLDDALESYQAAMATVERGPRLAKFREAENLFRRALEENGQPAGADLYVNIGNAALEAGRVGHAVVAYHQAMTVDPGHRQANANLAFVRSTLPEWLHPTEAYSLTDSLFFWKSYLSESELTSVAGIFFLFACCLLAASRFWQKTILATLALLPIFVWCVLIASMYLDSTTDQQTLAIVVADEVTARSADSITSASRFSSNLPAGAELQLMETREGWSRVVVGGDQSAWVPVSAIEIVDVN